MARLDLNTILRGATVAVLIGAAIAALAVSSRHRPASVIPSREPASANDDLHRCRVRGEAAANDPLCQAAEQRLHDHFFGLDAKGRHP